MMIRCGVRRLAALSTGVKPGGRSVCTVPTWAADARSGVGRPGVPRLASGLVSYLPQRQCFSTTSNEPPKQGTEEEGAAEPGAMPAESATAEGPMDHTEDGANWEYDAPSFSALAERDKDHGVTDTPILDEYDRTRDPEMLERILQLARDSVPPRAGPRRNNAKRRQHQKWRTVNNIRYKAKEQQMAARERKLQKRRDRRAADNAMFEEWKAMREAGVRL